MGKEIMFDWHPSREYTVISIGRVAGGYSLVLEENWWTQAKNIGKSREKLAGKSFELLYENAGILSEFVFNELKKKTFKYSNDPQETVIAQERSNKEMIEHTLLKLSKDIKEFIDERTRSTK